MLPIPPADVPFTYPDGVAGSWTGYFEVLTLPSGSDAISIELGQNAGGDNEIRVVVGAGSVPSPPTVAASYWPPRRAGQFDTPRYIEGYPYVAHLVQWQGKRLRFSLAPHEPWQAWCQLQPSFPYGGGQYGCAVNEPQGTACECPGAPSLGTCHAIGSTVATSTCAQMDTCTSRVCACDAAECIADPGRDWPFDITFDSATSAAGATSNVLTATLRLMK